MLKFYYGTMGSGKTTAALQLVYDLKKSDYEVDVWSGFTRDGNFLSSRMGFQVESLIFNEETSFLDIYQNNTTTHLVIDESQFLTAKQVDELFYLADSASIRVYVFGLLAAFDGSIFPASQRLMILSGVDAFALPIVPSCFLCGESAVVPARFINGSIQTDGPLVMVGDLNDSEANVEYRSLCREHYYYFINKKQGILL